MSSSLEPPTARLEWLVQEACSKDHAASLPAASGLGLNCRPASVWPVGWLCVITHIHARKNTPTRTPRNTTTPEHMHAHACVWFTSHLIGVELLCSMKPHLCVMCSVLLAAQMRFHNEHCHQQTKSIPAWLYPSTHTRTRTSKCSSTRSMWCECVPKS